MVRIITLMCLLCLLANATFGQTPGQSKDNFGTKVININVNQPWTATGVICSIGDTMYITLSGLFSSATDDPNAWRGPDGNGWSSNSSYPVPAASVNSVIGKVGANGTGFPVGSYVIYPADAAGELFLGINDVINFSDNGGTLVARVIKQRNHVLSKIVRGSNEAALSFSVSQNYPNPFNPSTKIEYELTQRDNIDVNIFNSAGQLVRSLINEQKEAGRYSIVWDGRDNIGNTISSGAYFYEVKVGDLVQAKKMLLLK